MPFDGIVSKLRREDYSERTRRTEEALTEEALRAWLSKQDPGTTYEFVDPYNCLLFRYLRAQGLRIRSVSPDWVRFEHGPNVALPERLNEVARETPRTYGGALGRLG